MMNDELRCKDNIKKVAFQIVASRHLRSFETFYRKHLELPKIFRIFVAILRFTFALYSWSANRKNVTTDKLKKDFRKTTHTPNPLKGA